KSAAKPAQDSADKSQTQTKPTQSNQSQSHTPEKTSEPVNQSPSSTKTDDTVGRPGGADGGKTAGAQEKTDKAAEIAGESAHSAEQGDAGYSEESGMDLDYRTGMDQYMTGPVPEGKPVPVDPQNTTITDVAHTCTISISCAAILGNMDWLDPDKTELVPGDGWILKPTSVTFYEGESVFNVLQRVCKQNKIHMEFENMPLYNSAYIEGINNLYEFDCGELSGWMYKVNDWFPNYGCSRYAIHDGDVVAWVYTCNLGIDVGGYSAAVG
ncbi:MAG: DUF4430 domain-containing protein, partial [Oscillospiraceae bacterium]|nr:DUF4430 domain-containing protein [Oscillospiraceae bacterium]